MMINWWSKHVGVILSVLMCDIWIKLLLQTSALVEPLQVVSAQLFTWFYKLHTHAVDSRVQGTDLNCWGVNILLTFFVCNNRQSKTAVPSHHAMLLFTSMAYCSFGRVHSKLPNANRCLYYRYLKDLYLFIIHIINFYVHIVLYSFCPVGIPAGMVYSIRK
jgi:hypothetical protein